MNNINNIDIGIISALSEELIPLIEKIENVQTEEISGVKYYTGKINNSKIAAAVCGVGKINAAICAQTMILKYSPKYIINIGVAGSISPNLGIRDIIVAESVVQHDIDTTPFGDPFGLIPKINIVQIPCSEKLNKSLLSGTNNGGNVKTGIIATGDKFINSQKDIDFISQTFKASAVDMEGGSIGHVCYVNSVEFAIIRSISDTSDDSSHIVYEENLVKSAQTSIDLLMKIL